MSLSIGIIGLPNIGKSTLFNALTEQNVPAENYRFCTIDPSVGIVPVPDPRLAELSKLSKSEKTIPAVVQFVDIAGLVKGAADGEGLGNKFLSHVREVDAVAHVVRAFEDKEVHHVHGEIDPLNDIEIVNTELALSDLTTVENRLKSVEGELKRGEKGAAEEKELLTRAVTELSDGKKIEAGNEKEEKVLKSLQLLSNKPTLYILNSAEKDTKSNMFKTLTKSLDSRNLSYVAINPYEGDTLRPMIKASYKLLGLITFFTTGEDETRGWTIRYGSSAPQAGAAIHSDFQDKFIRASVVSYDDLIELGSEAAAREKGKLRTEGKQYIVKDGDVIEFKI